MGASMGRPRPHVMLSGAEGAAPALQRAASSRGERRPYTVNDADAISVVHVLFEYAVTV